MYFRERVVFFLIGVGLILWGIYAGTHIRQDIEVHRAVPWAVYIINYIGPGAFSLIFAFLRHRWIKELRKRSPALYDLSLWRW